MSVINKMLQDLDSRQGGESADAVYTAPPKSQLLLWLSVTILIMVIIAYGIVYWLGADDASQPVPEDNPQSVSMPPAKKMPVVQPAKSAADNNTVAKLKPESSQPVDNNAGMQAAQSTSTAAEQPLPVTDPVIEQPTLVDNVTSAEAQEPAPSQLVIKAVELTQQQQVEQLQKRIQDALAQKDNAGAIQILKQLLKLDPGHSKARQKIANLLNAQGKIIDAEQVLRTGLRLDNGDVAQRMMLARLNVQQGRVKQARDLLAEYQPQAELHPDYYALMAGLAEQSNDYGGALKAYKILTSAQKHKAKWWLGLAVSADRLEQYPLALSAYQQVLDSAQMSESVQEFVQQRIAALRL